ncbi:MAG: hypothetical protein Q4G37_00020 [Bifidobacterium sp.]|nr:hypothetical protein [Bifidobacterium sp.]
MWYSLVRQVVAELFRTIVVNIVDDLDDLWGIATWGGEGVVDTRSVGFVEILTPRQIYEIDVMMFVQIFEQLWTVQRVRIIGCPV